MDRDISSWGWGQILELPDHLFGRRYVVGCAVALPGAGAVFEISLAALPERCVIWEWSVVSDIAYSEGGSVALALGDVAPTTEAGFTGLPTLLPDIGLMTWGTRYIMVSRDCQYDLRCLKVGLNTHGQRLVVRFYQAGSSPRRAMVNLVVSSVPRSIPEWYG